MREAKVRSWHNGVVDADGVPELIQSLGFSNEYHMFYGQLFNGATFKYYEKLAVSGICGSLIDKYKLTENPYIRYNLEKLIMKDWEHYADKGDL